MARGKSVRDQTAGYRFQNLGGITVGFEGRLESGLGFEMCRIYEVVCPGRDYTEPWIYILGERRLSVAIWGLVEVGVGFLGWGMRSEPDFSFGI